MTTPFPSAPAKGFPRALAALVVGAALCAFPMAGFAQDAAAPADAAAAQPSPDTVVATVGGENITEADLAFAAEDLGQELASVPPEQRKAFLLTILIDMKVMAKAAKDQAMDQTDIFKRRLAYLSDRALRRAYFSEKVTAAVTPESLQAAYDEFVKTFQPQDEVRARHILVATEDDAKAIKTELANGASFEELAKAKSTDPSAQQNGGELGFFSKGQMVPAFEEAAFALPLNQLSDPVQSQFGWHIIEVEEQRKSTPPTMEQIAPQLQQQVLFKSFDDTVAQLKANTAIEIPDAALAAAIKEQQTEQVPAP